MDFAAGEDHHQLIDHLLSFPIILSDQIRHAVDESKYYKSECIEAGKLVDHLSKMLRSFVRQTNATATATSTVYVRPVRRVFSEVTRNLTRALILVRRCRRRSIFFRVVTIVSAGEFRKLCTLLEASIGDMRWLLSVFDAGGDSGVVLSLPPIACNDPIIAWVWSYITSLYLIPVNARIEVANELCLVAKVNDRNKKMIAEEGGIPPLLKLLKEDSQEAQIAAAITLYTLANNQDRARLITSELGVPIIGQCLQKSPIRVQISVTKLIGRMAENDEFSQEAFARENVIRPLVTILSFETIENQYEKQSFHSIVKINKVNSMSAASSATTIWSVNRNKRENEPSELKLELKTSCSRALWMLARGNLANCKILTDTKGLLILAKLIETETGELQTNCLMNVMEIAAAAESNSDLRRAAFKSNSPAAKAVVDQLLKLIHESEIAGILIPAIRSIGSLARTFPARETRVIGPLVKQLSHQNPDVVSEAAIALGKFASSDNFLCAEHSNSIIEFDGVNPLMRLLRGNDRTQPYALLLLCFLAKHAGDSEALLEARVLIALEGADKSTVGQHPHLRELIMEAIHRLNMYHAGVIPSRRVSYSH